MAEFQKFCGGVFWDNQLTWNTSRPDFTPCFQITVIVWAPCAFLWLIFPLYTWYLASRSKRVPPLDKTKLHLIKTICSVFIAFVAVLDLLYSVSEYTSGNKVPLAYLVSPGVQVATFALVCFLQVVEQRSGIITSGMLFLFWVFAAVAGLVPLYSKILNATSDAGITDLFRFVTFMLYYSMVLVQLVCVCLAEALPKTPEYSDPKLCPEVRASFLSILTFWWINSIVLKGYKKDLVEDDLWSLNPRDRSSNVSPPFEEAWEKENERARIAEIQRKSAYSVVSYDDEKDEETPLLNGSAKKNYDTDVKIEQPKVQPSLMKVLVKLYGLTLFKAHSCKIVYDVLVFVNPMLLKLLIDYSESDQPEWKGFLYASLFLVNAVVMSFFFHQLFHIGMTLGMQMKAALIAAIYKKALLMSNDAKKTSTVGEIVNLMSVDAQRMQDVVGYLWMCWSSVFQITLALVQLYNELGPSVFAGLAVMIILIPVNGSIAAYQRKLQIKQMKLKDERIKLMNEVLNGIKVLKLYAWETSFQDKVSAIRAKELANLKKNAYLSAVSTFTWTCAPFMVTLACFATYVLIDPENVLTASKAFVSLSLFNILRFPMSLLPVILTYIVTASVSVKRIAKFLSLDDLDDFCVSHDKNADHPIEIENGTFSWSSSDGIALSNINLQVPDGGLCAVVGQVGAGKSSLISALLGEMEKIDGSVNVRGSVAYLQQQAWIQNATLKENILFGSEFDQKTYDDIIDSCALRPDLDILPGGDMTEIGEKGINLSGGQKQRVSLARAVYADADIYYLDDPLSAVDSHVGKHIFEKVVGPNGLLAKKTRILVTHGLHWLPKVDTIAVVDGGRIVEFGTYEELVAHDGVLAQLLRTYLNQNDDESESEDEEILEMKEKIAEAVSSMSEHSDLSGDESIRSNIRRKRLRSMNRQISRQSSKLPSEKKLLRMKSHEEPPVLPPAKDKLIEEEKSAEGSVRWSVFLIYLKALRYEYILPTLILFLGSQACSVVSNVWLSEWSVDPVLNNATIDPQSSVYLNTRDLYLGVYGGLGLGQGIFVLLFALGTAICAILASKNLHFSMLSNILQGPMSFFDTTPVGRIVNRFSRDIETVDNLLPNTFRSYLNTSFTALSTIIIISYSTPIFMVVILPIAIMYGFIQRFYIPTARQLKRLESTTRSPIYTHFSETITGSPTIRAYQQQGRFIKESETRVDKNLVYYFSAIASNRWLGFRLEFVGSLVVFCAALFAVLGKGTISSGLVGLSVSYALQVTGSLNWMVRMSSELETHVVSVERIVEYSEQDTEAEWYIEETKPDKTWPSEGKLEFEEYSTRYRPGLDLVLKDITLYVSGGEKVGVVGRTGAGKSSLTLSLFRLIEAASGKIRIDGKDISKLGLHQLRSKLTILPQDPVLFSGTLRMNLDPFGQKRDAQIWTALEHAHLKDFVYNKPEGLDYECGEGGINLSVGQRQLICLARTLLLKTKILILDEATAAVDMETDDLIQNTIRREFADCTIITIAHRLNTILDNDKVLVLDKGKIKEFDSPSNLLRNKNTIFYSMAKDAGLV